MIIVTGAAGFIGSCLVAKLNNLGKDNIVIVDDFSNVEKNKNLIGKKFLNKIERSFFLQWLYNNFSDVSEVYHIGARTDTTEFNSAIFDQLNLNYSKKLWSICVEHNISFIYASSAATYGLGEYGFVDSHDIINKLQPLNPYAKSKHEFDIWVLNQHKKPPFWAGFKFFNVYGPNEFHKNRMASVIFHATNQIKESSKMNLFQSHNSDYKDGQQLRDFIYVKDVIEVLVYMMNSRTSCGIFNLGSGKARTFNDLVNATFLAMNKQSNISYISIPEDIREKYQYFTEANMMKLRSVGYKKDFTTLEEGVDDYVRNYLINKQYY